MRRSVYDHDGVIVQRRCTGPRYRRSAERRKLNVLEMQCLKSLVGVSRKDRVELRCVEDLE